MMSTRTWILAVPLAALLTACGSSPPNKYYRLTAEAAATASGEQPSLGIGPIEIPEYLNRDRLVYNQQGNTVEIAATARWAEPLDAGIQRVLALNLAGLLDTQNVSLFPWDPQRAPDYGVKINLLALDAGPDTATLTAEWLVYSPGNANLSTRKLSQLSLPFSQLPAGAEQVPAAFSQLLLQLSETIAASIAAHRNLASPVGAAGG